MSSPPKATRDPSAPKKAAPKKAALKRAAAPQEPILPERASVPEAARLITKTPMFAAMHASRYQRQALIREIETRTGAVLICYVSGANCQIEDADTIGFVELLHNVPAGRPIDLILHTCGGDVDAAEKLINLVKARQGDDKIALRMIIPDAAKSAGTLMALGANELLMSDSSELGMIDPQAYLKDDAGNEICTSVVAYLEAFREHSETFAKSPTNPVAQAMFQRFDPVIVRKFQLYVERTRDIAERMLNRWGAASTTISHSLLDVRQWKSHNQMIGHGDARQLGLNVTYLPPDDELWQLCWHLYCMQWLEVGKNKKLFESRFVSQVFER
jgi:ATP-dependent protease ClpP protease subunit